MRPFLSTSVVALFCAVPKYLGAETSQEDDAARQKGIQEESAKRKAAGPQRDHGEDAANYAKAQADTRARGTESGRITMSHASTTTARILRG